MGEALEGRRSRRTATLASLAAELGVSRTTVSNAYNRPDQLSPALRRRVLDTARRLGYPGPDPVARSLRTRKAGAVGLLLTEALSYAFRDPVAVQFLEGLALACEDNGSGLLLVPVSPEADDPGAVARAGVDGFVVYSMPDDDDNFAAVLERPVPVVVCDQPTAVSDVDRVGIDDHAAMVDMARHLAGLGHRKVGVLCMRLSTERNDGFASVGRQENARYEVQRRRLSGLREGFAEAGVDWSTVPVVERFDHSESAGASGAEQLLARHDVTAIACTSDLLALGALRHVRESGPARARRRSPSPASTGSPRPSARSSPPSASRPSTRAARPASSCSTAATVSAPAPCCCPPSCSPAPPRDPRGCLRQVSTSRC